ncbi:MAG: ATP-binding cassette domain-containing protein, partial [Eubacteriales bacterium]|nr:ATP-binding cassette domain-containing protein [Eubacteriales bacterium]
MQENKNVNYLTAKESRQISRENRRITNQIEKNRNRRNIPEAEYLTNMQDDGNVVEFDGLKTYFYTDIGVVRAVDGISFNIPKGKTVGVVGESGCGKSVTSLSLMQLVQ